MSKFAVTYDEKTKEVKADIDGTKNEIFHSLTVLMEQNPEVQQLITLAVVHVTKKAKKK